MKRFLSSYLLLLASLVSSLPGVHGANYSAFTNDGELRVALESWVANDTAQVIAKYGTMDAWNVSLVTDFKGILRGRDAGVDHFDFVCFVFGTIVLRHPNGSLDHLWLFPLLCRPFSGLRCLQREY